MKNINSFMDDSNVVELNSTELNEIIGGNLWASIKQAWEDVKYAIYEAYCDAVKNYNS